jgi:heme/copper-type cytochrome/quinol oxidase subunit 3
MGLLTSLLHLIPGFRHIAAGCVVSGVMWFAAFTLALNFGILTPVAWPGGPSRILRVVLCGAAFVVLVASHRRAGVAERRARRRAAKQAAAAGGAR